MIPIERTHEFRGRYHVLGGALSPIDGVEPEDLKIAELYARVEARRASREVVLATNPTTTGEATALHIADGLRERAPDVDRHAPRLRPAGRRRPRVRRRGHARPALAGRRPSSRLDSAAVPGTVVMKFGGTSVADAERIKRAARADRRARASRATASSRCCPRAARPPTS